MAVAEELHFGRAAQRLHLTQSPLSRQIQMLERELGVALLIRANRTVRLTQAGHVFLVEAGKLLGAAEEAVQVLHQAVRVQSGAAAIRFIGACSYGLLPRLVAARAAGCRADLPRDDDSAAARRPGARAA